MRKHTMAYVSPFEDAPTTDAAQLREASGANDNVLSRSLRGGFYGAGSQLLSTGAAVADAVGADNVGAGLHTRSKGLRDTAALPGNAPRVGSYSQLRDDFSMDNLGEYVGGLVGGSLPVTAAGIAGGMATGGAGFVPAMLGAGAATMPFNVGEVVQRQQSDPQALQQGAGQRLGEAVLGGAGASAVESLVPGLVGRQILGKGVGNLAKESFKQMAGRNAMDIPLEGLTEGTGTAIKQFAANQDKALDWNEIKEGAIGGAAAGSVFTGVGTAADALHSVAPKTGEMLGDARTSINERLAKLKGAAGEKVEAAAATAPGKKVKSAYDEVADLVERGKQKFDDTLDKVMKGEELGSPADWLKATTDEAKKYMTDLSDSEKVKAVTKAAKEMMDDVGLDAAKRADLADAMKNTGDRASQVTIATMKKAWDLSKKAGGMLSDLADAVSEGYDAHKRRDVDVDVFTVDEGEAGSEFTPAGLLGKSGAAADVTDVTPKGEPAKMTLREFAAARKAFIAKAMSEGKTEDEARGLFNTSQNKDRVGAPPPPEVPKMSEDYSGVHAVIADAIKKNGIVERRPELFDSDKKVNIMADTMRKLIEQMSKGPVKLSVMKKTMRLLGDDAVGVLSSLKDAMKYDADPAQTEQFFQNINTMMDVEKGEKTLHEVMNASMVDQNKTHHTAQDADVLIAHARGKMDGSRFRSPGEAAVSDRLVNEFYERTYGENADMVRAAVEKAAGMEGRKRAEGGDRLDENGAEVESSEGGFDEAGNRITAGSTDRQVYGVSKPNAAGQQSKQLNGLAMHKDSAQVQRIIDDLRKPTTGRKRSGTEKANEYAAVDSNGDYVYDIRFEQLPGSEFGHVVIEKYDNTKEFNETDLASIAHNTHDYPDSPSRLNVGGHALDATKIVNVARKKMQDSFESDTPKSAIQRMRESFSYGISMLTDQFGERINVPDAAVIGFINGEPVTWGKARKYDGRSAMDKERDTVTQDIVKARAAWAKAKEDGAPEEVLAELKATYQELVRLEAGVLNDELGRGEDYQGRSHKRQRPLTVVETRDAVERGENPWSPMRGRDHLPPTNSADPLVRNVYPENLNGETKDDTGALAPDKDGNIHALKDYSGPVFGGNDKNRVTRKPWGTVDRQDDPQPTLDGKRVKNKQTDLAPKEENLHRSNMDGSGHYVGADKMKRGNLIDAIDSWDGTVSAEAASVKAKAESLLANFDKMSRADRVRFTSIAPNDVKATRGLPAVKMEPMGLADARTIVNELAAKYKDVIAVPGATAESIPTRKGVVHERNPVQFYNEGKAGKRGPVAQPTAKPSINEKLVDKVVLSENYPTTVKGAEKFLNAAKKRLAALEAEDHRVLNDDDHPTNRLPEEEQKVLDALRQTFDKNSDLAPFFTELDGWGAVPEVEQIRLMEFAESLTGGKPSPKPQAPARGAARFGDEGSLTRMQAEFPALTLRHTTINERVEIAKHLDALAVQLGDKMPRVEGFSIRDGTKGDFAGKAVTRDGQHHILLSKELFDDTTPFLGSIADKVERATIHEVGHLVDREHGNFSDNSELFFPDGELHTELKDYAARDTDAADWFGYALRKVRTPQREMYAQAFAAFHYAPEVLRDNAPKTYEFFKTHTEAGERPGRVQSADRRAANVAREDSSIQEASTDTTQVKQQSFLARAAAGDKALLEEIKTSTNAKGLQRALDLLNDHEFESGVDGDNVLDAYDAIEGRLSELVQDPDVAYGLQTRKYSLESAEGTDPNATHTQAYRDSVKAHIVKVLGNSVKTAWKNLTTMQHAGDYTHALKLIRLSVHALDPMSTAYHESLHAFFAQLRDSGATDITRVLEKAASSDLVMRQLEDRYKNQPAVLAQLKDPEERAAYMYQMWASDPTFKVSIGARNVFQKIAAAIRKVLGVWTNDERALHIMEYFHSGEYAKAMGSPSAVRAALMDSHRSQILETAESFAKPLGDLADAIVGTGGARLRDTGIPALQTLADIIRRDHTTEGGDQGFIPASRMAGTKMRNDLGEKLEMYTKEMLADAMQALQSNTPAVSAEGRLAVREIKDFLKDAHRYMRQAGVDIGDLGPDYFPRVWDTHYISKNQQAFRNMLEPYIRSGQMKGTADQLIHNLLARGGAEFGIESRESTQPGMQHRKERLLNFITPQDAAQFVNKDLMGTLSNYINQATRKAEWTRRLGGGHLEELIEQAMTQGATKQQLALAEDYMKGVDGTLGDDINPTARRLMGDMIVYQNVRLLSTAAFSMLIDPLGVMVRGGTVADSWNTFKRGIAGIKDTFKKDGMGATDQAAKWAELVGVVDDAMMAGVMADVYTQGMVDGTARKINNAFFKYNLVEGLNRNFRIGASEAAMKFLAHHIGGLDGKGPSPHSTRWMKELGLQKGDIQLVNGRIALTQQEGLQAAQVGRVHLAINQWVDGAVLRPDASTKPIWMNDPHYALFAHLKQFVFSFQETILKRVFHEVKSGNYTPVMVLASYVPVMMAADMAKGALVNAGDTPEWQKGWGAGDYLGYAVERAGLYGVGQFGVDMAQDLHRGGSGIGALTGPTIEQLTDIMNTLGGHRQFGTTLIDAMPANNVLKGWSGGPEQVQTE